MPAEFRLPRDRPCYLSGMGKGWTTREAIIDEALRQATRVGLEGLSLGPLAEKLGLSKSGLFAHFKSKEALQREILAEAVERFKRQVIGPASHIADPKERLRALFANYLTWARGTDEDGGCLFVTMAQEYDDRPGIIRDELVASQASWREYLANVVGLIAADSSGDRADVDQAVFELTGAALAFQQSAKLMGDEDARRRALRAVDRIILLAEQCRPGR